MADQTFCVKMARPDDRDLDAATDLMCVLDSLSRGYYPTDPKDKAQGAEAPMWFDSGDQEHLEHLHAILQSIMERAPGFQGRVMMGMAVVCAPGNNIIDPQADCLELSPHLKAAVKAEQEKVPA